MRTQDSGRRLAVTGIVPRALRWFTADTGLHHVHPPSGKLPNYRLRECLQGNPELREARRLSRAESWKVIWRMLWDQEQAGSWASDISSLSA
jgi:fatty acid desaturase